MNISPTTRSELLALDGEAGQHALDLIRAMDQHDVAYFRWIVEQDDRETSLVLSFLSDAQWAELEKLAG